MADDDLVGSQAAEELVDQIGGVDDCVAYIAKKADWVMVQVTHRPLTESGLDLSSLLGNEDNDIISINPLGGGLLPLDSAALKLLRAQGLNTETLQLLIRDSLESKQKPTTWLMGPASLSIR